MTAAPPIDRGATPLPAMSGRASLSVSGVPRRGTGLRAIGSAASIARLAIALLFLLPPRLVVGGLGAAGRPALVLGAGMLVWWLASRMIPGLMIYGRQPVRWLLGGFLVVHLLSYVAGLDRGLDGVEMRSADRSLITVLALCGFTLIVADGVPSRESLDRLLRWLLWGAAFMAVAGELQFLVGFDVTRFINVPGLSINRPLIGVGNRGAGGGFARVAGTAGHYIEFGVILGMLLPVALHYALFARSRAERQRRWVLVAVLAVGIPFSISRAAVLSLAVGLGVLLISWTLRQQYAAVVGLFGFLVVMRILKPGLLGTIQALFQNAKSDPSIQNRQSDYAVVADYVSARPWFGRGAGTFIPERYTLLDNQALGTVVAEGFLGLVALAALFLVPFCLARRVRRNGADEETQHLGQALAASVVVAAACSLTFDSLSFTTFSGTLFLVIGAIGALWRLDKVGRAPDEPPAVRRERRLLRQPAHRGGEWVPGDRARLAAPVDRVQRAQDR